MLRALRGRAHDVVTGVALARDGEVVTGRETTEVVFAPMTDEEVDAYLWDRNHDLVDSDEDWVRWSRRVGRWAYALAISRLRAELTALRGQVGRELAAEEYDENAPLRNMAPLAVRVPRLPVRPEAGA